MKVLFFQRCLGHHPQNALGTTRRPQRLPFLGVVSLAAKQFAARALLIAFIAVIVLFCVLMSGTRTIFVNHQIGKDLLISLSSKNGAWVLRLFQFVLVEYKRLFVCFSNVFMTFSPWVGSSDVSCFGLDVFVMFVCSLPISYTVLRWRCLFVLLL